MDLAAPGVRRKHQSDKDAGRPLCGHEVHENTVGTHMETLHQLPEEGLFSYIDFTFGLRFIPKHCNTSLKSFGVVQRTAKDRTLRSVWLCATQQRHDSPQTEIVANVAACAGNSTAELQAPVSVI